MPYGPHSDGVFAEAKLTRNGGNPRTPFVTQVRDLGQWIETAYGQLKSEQH